MSDHPKAPGDGAKEPAPPRVDADDAQHVQQGFHPHPDGLAPGPAGQGAAPDLATETRLRALEAQVHWLTWRLRTMEQGGNPASTSAVGPSTVPGAGFARPAGAPAYSDPGTIAPPQQGFAPPHGASGGAGFAPPPPSGGAPAAALPDGEGTERWVLRAGVLLLALGLAYLFRYSVEQGWLDELARVITGGVLGVVLIGIGLVRQRTRPLFAGLLHSAGAIAWIVTLGAASHWYGLLAAPAAWFGGIAVLLAATALSTTTRQAAPLLGAGGASAWLFFHLQDHGGLGALEHPALLALVLVPAAAALAALARSVRALPWAASAFVLALPLVLFFETLHPPLLPWSLRLALWAGAACILTSLVLLSRREAFAGQDLQRLVPLLPFPLWALDAIGRGESVDPLLTGIALAAGLGALAFLAARPRHPAFGQGNPAAGDRDTSQCYASAPGDKSATALAGSPGAASGAHPAGARDVDRVGHVGVPAADESVSSAALTELLGLAAAGALLTGVAATLHSSGWTVGLLTVALCLHHAAGPRMRAGFLLPAWGATGVALLWIGFQILFHLDGKEQPDGLRLLWPVAAGVLLLTAWATRRTSLGRIHVMLAAFGGLLALAGTLHALPNGPVLASVLWAVVTLLTLTQGLRTRSRTLVTVGLTILGILIVKVLFIDLQGLETVWRVLALMGMGAVFLAFGYFVPGLLRGGEDSQGSAPPESS